MTRFFIGLAIGGMLTLLKAYPAYSEILFSIDLFQAKPLMTIVPETIMRSEPIPILQQRVKAPEEALTLSRFKRGGLVHILAVVEDNGASVTGVDLSLELGRYSTNSFDVIQGKTYHELVSIIRKSTKRATIPYAELLPSVAGNKHLAIGINYAEHGKETGQVKPFMFPKLVATDAAIHHLVYTKGWLLDHEVELGIVFSSAVCRPADLNRMMIGFLVVNDFTDRATLMRQMDSENVSGGKGFPDAKSKPGFLPTGPYLVIPKDWRHFVKELRLTLSVNGAPRQDGQAKEMVWDIDKIVERSLSVKGKNDSYYQNKRIKLFEGSCIPANSIIITGTPSGVVFHAPDKGFIAAALARYVFTGAFFSAKMHPYILQRYLLKETKNPNYLKPGDRVQSSISYLGTIRTTVTAHDPEITKRK